MAFGDGALHGPAALAALTCALLIQVATNLANDLCDFEKGADTEARLGPMRVTQAGLVSPETMRRGIVAVLALTFLCGLYLVGRGGWPILVIGVTSVAAGLLYTGGPRPLGYMGLGDLLVLVFFGPVAVAGTYYVQALTVNATVSRGRAGAGADLGRHARGQQPARCERGSARGQEDAGGALRAGLRARRVHRGRGRGLPAAASPPPRLRTGTPGRSRAASPSSRRCRRSTVSSPARVRRSIPSSPAPRGCSSSTARCSPSAGFCEDPGLPDLPLPCAAGGTAGSRRTCHPRARGRAGQNRNGLRRLGLGRRGGVARVQSRRPRERRDRPPAAILLTSGTAGVPKAALHTCGNHYYNALGSNANLPLVAENR